MEFISACNPSPKSRDCLLEPQFNKVTIRRMEGGFGASRRGHQKVLPGVATVSTPPILSLKLAERTVPFLRYASFLAKGRSIISHVGWSVPRPLKLVSSKAFPGGIGGANLSAGVSTSVKARDPKDNFHVSGISGFQIFELSGYFVAAQAGERF
jgi:hypothetical protein